MSGVITALQKASRAGTLSETAVQFAGLLERQDPEADPSVLLAGALAAERALAGDVCIDLASIAGSIAWEGDSDGDLLAPDCSIWQQALRRCSLVGDGGRLSPLVLTDDGRLYLYRYYALECRLAEAIGRHARRVSHAVDALSLAEGLDTFFSDDPGSADQRAAAAKAVDQHLLVISGGPGTGKTATVVRILALVQQLTSIRAERILLCAPTGKAAARLREVLANAEEMLPEALQRVPQPVTVHRLLGVRPGQRPRYDAARPLPCDLLVLDEASMVDLSLMTSLFDAIPQEARLILLGDRDQLSSVEAGAVLGDICHAADQGTLPEALITLRHNWRFSSASALGGFASAVREGDISQVTTLLENADPAELEFVAMSDTSGIDTLLADRVIPHFADLERLALEGAPAETLLARRDEAMVLCAHRHGPRGVADINMRIQAGLRRAPRSSSDSAAFVGMPLIVMRNDSVLGLFNGDIGIVVPDRDHPGGMQAVFQDALGEIRAISLSRLPEYQPAFAFTVHKAQGSQSSAVTLILPEKVSPILSRELVYTGATRAQDSLQVWGSPEVLSAAIERSARRPTGLARRLQRREMICP